MRRWNGWGDETTSKALPRRAAEALAEWVGAGTPPRDATRAEALAAVPASRLAEGAGLSTDPWERLLHARGQSLPDWIALRSGRLGVFPDAVAFPETGDEVAGLLARAKREGARVVPYGGGTSVAGHVNPVASDSPVVTLDLGRLSRLESLDATSRLATFGAGVRGPDLEAVLRAHGERSDQDHHHHEHHGQRADQSAVGVAIVDDGHDHPDGERNERGVEAEQQ